MKVLRIINRFNLGGPTYNAAYLSRYLGEGTETRLIGGKPLDEEAHSGFILDELGVPYEELPEMGRSINPLDDYRAFRKIRKIIREYRPDIVHTHAAKAGLLGRIAAKLEGVPVIVHTYHGHVFSGYFSPWKTALVKRMERWLAKKSHAIITISREQFNDIVVVHKICSPEKARIIPLGFDLDRFIYDQEEKRNRFRKKYALDQQQVAIGIVGRFAPVKNHRLFFDTLSLVFTKEKNARAFVIGDGNAMQAWKEYVATRMPDDKDKVIFTSWIKNMDEAMSGLDIVALTSLNEGTPVSLIEAQAAARPVLTTNAGGVKDCMLEDVSGKIIPDFTASSMADGMLELIRSKEREKMGKAGREFVLAHFSYQRLVSDVRSLYEKLLQRNIE